MVIIASLSSSEKEVIALSGCLRLSATQFSHNINFFFFLHLQTNDLFVTNYDDSEIVQIIGFPPGLDVEVVTANIQNETEVALEILLGGRRKLKADQQPTLDVKNNNRALETKAAKTKAAKGKAGTVEVEIPSSDESESYMSLSSPSAYSLLYVSPHTMNASNSSNQHFVACTVAADILNAATPEAAAGIIGGLLEQTFNNGSFTQTILSGGVSEVFDGNITLRKALALC